LRSQNWNIGCTSILKSKYINKLNKLILFKTHGCVKCPFGLLFQLF
jgi:hypothetical protein